MKSWGPRLKKSLVLIALSFLCVFIFLKGSGVQTSWSLLPPALGIFIAFVSHRLSLSLGAAVLLGTFILHFGKHQGLMSLPLATLDALQIGFNSLTDKTNIQILGFVFFILSSVHIMTASGGLHALVRALQKKVVGPRSAQLVTAILGCLIFIDDYANTMIVGSTMKKVTDRYGISRAKLAFLVDATSAPIAGIALVSTWIGYEVGLFTEMSKKFTWNVDGYSVFLDALGFRFYCIFMLFFVFANVISGVDFGPMREANKEHSPLGQEDLKPGSLWSSLLPLGLLLGLVFSLLWWDGGGFEGQVIWSLTSWRQVLSASENGIFILLVSSVVGYVTAVMTAVAVGKTPLLELKAAFLEGVKSAILPIMILVLAWSLKNICDQLNTGEYIVSLLGQRMSPVWLPFSVFIVSAVTAFATGTSWGTMAILIPTVTPLALSLAGGEYGVYVALSLAAILDGAIMGDHCSPVSDTTIMSSISTDCDLIEHVHTQLPYSLVVGFLALFVGYLPMGMEWPRGFSFAVSLVLIIGLFVFLKSQRGAGKAFL
ncbi:MAG: hypothetical protein KDD33_06805 [Bdellovibrionales bacterium]|nr:hypothetical protein [Bdellovibrionales bacterium]